MAKKNEDIDIQDEGDKKKKKISKVFSSIKKFFKAED